MMNILRFIFVFLVVTFIPIYSLALPVDQKKVFDLGIKYFNVDASLLNCDVSTDTNLSGNGSAQIAFNFFVSKGLSANQAAGIVGNMMWESGLQPENIQNPAGSSKNPADAGGAGWGIVQWTPGSKVLDIAKAGNITTPIYELGTQLEVVWAQLTRLGGLEQQAGNDIKSALTIEDSVRAFQGDQNIGGKYVGFERPADERGTLSSRIRLSTQVLNKYGGLSITAPSSSGGCSSVGPGQDTQYVDGFTVYSQYDPSWANMSYGTTTISDGGCGPSAMAMIITALSGQQITPDKTAAYASSQNQYEPGAGSKWTIAPVLASHWNLKSQIISKNVAKITAALQNGGLVVASGQGPLPLTSGGHYIVIRGVTADGKWKIGDSGHNNTSAQEWDPQQLITYLNDGSIYAITK